MTRSPRLVSKRTLIVPGPEGSSVGRSVLEGATVSTTRTKLDDEVARLLAPTAIPSVRPPAPLLDGKPLVLSLDLVLPAREPTPAKTCRLLSESAALRASSSDRQQLAGLARQPRGYLPS
jgi:hypothetical protein